MQLLPLGGQHAVVLASRVTEPMGFAYNKGEDVLSDVTFTISQGVVAALVGSSGSGKSTVARLAARFWDDALLACSELYGIPVLPGYHE